MFLTLEHRFAFVHIPKTAGQQIFQLFVRGLPPAGWEPKLHIAYWGQDATTLTDLTHLHQGNLYDYVPKALYKSCVSFCVVRDPYNRFYSAFQDLPLKMAFSKKWENSHPFWTERYPEYANPKAPGVDAAATLAQFCDIVDTHKVPTDTITKHNIHLIPQHMFVFRKDGTQNVGTWLKFEALDTALPAWFTQHKLPFVKHASYTNKGKHWRKCKIHFNDLNPARLQSSYLPKYTPAAIALVNKWYKRDFEAFGYKMLDPASFVAPPPADVVLRHDVAPTTSSRTRKRSSRQGRTHRGKGHGRGKRQRGRR
jgi:hypothetical protein